MRIRQVLIQWFRHCLVCLSNYWIKHTHTHTHTHTHKETLVLSSLFLHQKNVRLFKIQNYDWKWSWLPWLMWLIWLGVVPQSKRLPVQFLVRAHAWVAGLSPGCVGEAIDQCFPLALMFLSPSFSFPLALSKNKYTIFFKAKKENATNCTVILHHLLVCNLRRATMSQSQTDKHQ